jgi:hypothetical protein
MSSPARTPPRSRPESSGAVGSLFVLVLIATRRLSEHKKFELSFPWVR